MATSNDRLFSQAFIALTASELAYFLAGGLLIGITPFFVLGPVEGDAAGLGLVFAAFSVTTLLLRPVAGRLADRRGRRPLLILGALLCAVVLLAHAVIDDLAVLIGLRLALGATEAIYFVAAIAALADLAPPGRAGEALSYNSLALYLGLAIGPVLGQGLVALGGFPVAWIGAAGLALLAGLLALRIPETSPSLGRATPSAPWIHRAAIAPGIALGLGVATMSAFFALGGPHAERIGLQAWSVTYLLFGGVVVAARLALARLPDRYPAIPVIVLALSLCGVGTLLTAVTPGVAGLLVGAGVLAVGVALLTPAVFAAIFAIVSPAERGVASGTASAFIDLGFGVGPLVVGSVAASLGIPAAFGLAAGVALAGSVATLLVPRRRPRTVDVA
jgi:MFS family permease